jgi:hypothetical protein
MTERASHINISKMTDEELLDQPTHRRHNWRTLTHDSFLPINLYLIKALGLETAIFLTFLVYRDKFYAHKKKLTEKDGFFGFFYCKQKSALQMVCLSPYEQRKALEKLKQLGLIEVQFRGIPKKTYVRINHRKLTEFMEKEADMEIQYDLDYEDESGEEDSEQEFSQSLA